MELFKIFGRIGLNGVSEVNKDLDDTTDHADSTAGKIGKAFSTMGKVALVGIGAAAAGIGTLTGLAVKAYADYEQLTGGVETLFKDSAKTVMKYAENAWQTSGLSANEYMEQATSFSASLLQSLGGDTEAAAKVTEMAIIDMADNANKMGSSMESIQNAYQGFAKQNYTMLDNLKLGYGGTKEEMQRLLEDAQKITGIEYNIDNLNDVYQAIHVIQGELGITGTTAEEAATTIQGSAAAMKSAWANLITGMADDSQDFDKLIKNFVKSVSTFAKNIIPRIKVALKGVAKLIKELAPIIIAELPGLIETILPEMLSAVSEIVIAISEVLPDLMGTIVQAIIDQAPKLLTAGLNMVLQLGKGFVKSIPKLIPGVINMVKSIASWISENVNLIVEGAVALVLALGEALLDPDNIEVLFNAAVEIVQAIANAIIENAPKLINGITKLFDSFGTLSPVIWAVIGALGALKGAMLISDIISGVKNAFAALNVVMTANPIGLIIAAIGALVAAFIWLWNNCEGFREFWINLWENIKLIVADVVAWIETAWNDLVTWLENTWNNVSAWIEKAWDDIVAWLQTARDSVVAWLQTALNNVVTFFQNTWNSIITFFQNTWESISTTVSTAVNTIYNTITRVFNSVKTTVTTVWNTIRTTISNVWNGIKTSVSNAVESVKTTVSTVWDSIKTTTSSVWNSIKNAVVTPIRGAKTTVSSIIETLKTSITSKFNSVWDTVTTVWENIKSAITTPIEDAKETIGNVIDTIKGFLNFEWSFPKLKMPHFSVTGSANPFDWFSQGVPKLTVEWYAKGGILDQPTIFGVNGATGKLMGGGEAGKEAVAPISTLQTYVSDAVRSELGMMETYISRLMQTVDKYLPELAGKDYSLVLDTGELVAATAGAMNSEIGSIYRRNERGG